MCEYAAVLNRFLTPRYPFQQTQSLLKALIGSDVDEIRRRKAVVRDENGSTLALDLGQQFRRSAFQPEQLGYRQTAASPRHPPAVTAHRAARQPAKDAFRTPRTHARRYPGTTPRPALPANWGATAAAATAGRADAGGDIHGSTAGARLRL